MSEGEGAARAVHGRLRGPLPFSNRLGKGGLATFDPAHGKVPHVVAVADWMTETVTDRADVQRALSRCAAVGRGRFLAGEDGARHRAALQCARAV